MTRESQPAARTVPFFPAHLPVHQKAPPHLSELELSWSGETPVLMQADTPLCLDDGYFVLKPTLQEIVCACIGGVPCKLLGCSSIGQPGISGGGVSIWALLSVYLCK